LEHNPIATQAQIQAVLVPFLLVFYLLGAVTVVGLTLEQVATAAMVVLMAELVAKMLMPPQEVVEVLEGTLAMGALEDQVAALELEAAEAEEEYELIAVLEVAAA
jgi:hypothetical protein